MTHACTRTRTCMAFIRETGKQQRVRPYANFFRNVHSLSSLFGLMTFPSRRKERNVSPPTDWPSFISIGPARPGPSRNKDEPTDFLVCVLLYLRTKRIDSPCRPQNRLHLQDSRGRVLSSRFGESITAHQTPAGFDRSVQVEFDQRCLILCLTRWTDID